MKKCLIVCWYGKLPDYFEIWQKSCSYNLDYDFFIFTDQEIEPISNNIIVHKMSLSKINELISEKLKLNVKIERPYKFCDFKPAYGKIFEDFIIGYDFWGHCDIDQIFGKINDFITDDILNNYEKINRLGHFCLYKNCKKINELYTKEGSVFPYTEVFTNDENYAFDEHSGLELIVKKNSIKIAYIKQYADLYIRNKRYKMSGTINYKNQAFLWKNGKLYRVYESNETLKKEELMYLHFQKKHPIIKVNNNSYSQLIIGCNYFDELKNNITLNDIVKCNPYNGKLYEIIEGVQYKYKKIIEFVDCNYKQRKIWIRQKIKK